MGEVGCPQRSLTSCDHAARGFCAPTDDAAGGVAACDTTCSDELAPHPISFWTTDGFFVQLKVSKFGGGQGQGFTRTSRGHLVGYWTHRPRAIGQETLAV